MPSYASPGSIREGSIYNYPDAHKRLEVVSFGPGPQRLVIHGDLEGPMPSVELDFPSREALMRFIEGVTP